MNRAVKYVDFALSRFLAGLMALMVLDVTWQVVSRFIVRRPSSFTEELATFLLIWIGLLGSAYGLRRRAHLGVDVLTNRLSGKSKDAAEIFVFLCIIVFAAMVLIWGGIRLVYISFHLNQISAALRVKIGYVYLVLPITGALFIFYSTHFLIEIAGRMKSREPSAISQATRVTEH